MDADQRTTKWSFDEGPCPCTNGSMKGKAIIKLPKTDSTTAADVYPPQSDCDGESDRLLIAHLSPTCSKVSYISASNKY